MYYLSGHLVRYKHAGLSSVKQAQDTRKCLSDLDMLHPEVPVCQESILESVLPDILGLDVNQVEPWLLLMSVSCLLLFKMCISAKLRSQNI